MSEESRIVGLDLGNGFIKVCSSTIEDHFPSVYSMQEPGVSFEGLAATDDLVIEIPNEGCYAVGTCAPKLGNISQRTLDISRVTGKDYRILFAAALATACRRSGEIAPVLSLPIAWYDKRDQVRKSLAGEWRIKVNGTWFTYVVPLNSIRLIPEGFGSICSLVLNRRGEVMSDEIYNMQVGVVDVGTKTADMLRFSNLEFMSARSDGIEMGLYQIYSLMSRYARSSGIRSLTIEELDSFLQGNPLYDGPTNIAEQAEVWKIQALEQAANSIAGKIRSMWQGGKEVQRLLLTGGGGQHLYPYLMQHFPDHLYPVPNGAMANAVGAYSYGIMKAG